MTVDVVETTNAMADAVITTRFELTPEGVLVAGHTVRNDGDGPLRLTGAAVVAPGSRSRPRGARLLRAAGRGSASRSGARPGQGAWLRETRHGRSGHDDPFLMMAGTPGFGFRAGEIWATHVAWSGDKSQWLEPYAARTDAPRRRRAAGPPDARAGRDVRRADRRGDVVGCRDRRPVRSPSPVDPVVVDHPLAAARDAQHLGGRVLRPLPGAARAARRARRRGGRRALRPRRRMVPRPHR